MTFMCECVRMLANVPICRRPMSPSTYLPFRWWITNSDSDSIVFWYEFLVWQCTERQHTHAHAHRMKHNAVEVNILSPKECVCCAEILFSVKRLLNMKNTNEILSYPITVGIQSICISNFIHSFHIFIRGGGAFFGLFVSMSLSLSHIPRSVPVSFSFSYSFFYLDFTHAQWINIAFLLCGRCVRLIFVYFLFIYNCVWKSIYCLRAWACISTCHKIWK